MQCGRTPTMDTKGSPFMAEVRNRLNCFLLFEHNTSEGKQTYYGSEAMGHLFGDMQAKVAKGVLPTSLQDLEQFHIFKWLLDDRQQEEVDKWTQQLLEKQGIASKQGPADSSKDATATAKSKKKHKKEEVEEGVNSLFS